MSAEGQPEREAASAEVVVGILADPDLPSELANELPDLLPPQLRDELSDELDWTVDRVHEPFESMFPGYSRLMDKAYQRVRDTKWDLAISLTDLPLRQESGKVVLAEIDYSRRVALASVPALGGVGLRRRLHRLLVPLVAYLCGPERPGAATSIELDRELGSYDVHEDGAELQILLRRRTGLLRLLAGMVRANRPWRLVAGLSTALAGAATGMAFGLLYSSIWLLASAMGPIRLAGTALVAVLALGSWMIVGHHLWERRPLFPDEPAREVRLRNAGTVVTVGVGTLVFYSVLFVVALAGAALIIPPDFLATNLGRPAQFSDYLSVGVMASILGTVAGAVGSGLEDDTAVREATYGYREQERRQQVQELEEQPET